MSQVWMYYHSHLFLNILQVQYCRQYQTLSEIWGDLGEGKILEVDDYENYDDKHKSLKTTIDIA